MYKTAEGNIISQKLFLINTKYYPFLSDDTHGDYIPFQQYFASSGCLKSIYTPLELKYIIHVYTSIEVSKMIKKSTVNAILRIQDIYFSSLSLHTHANTPETQ